MKYLLLAVGFFLSINAHAVPLSLEGYTVDAYMERTAANPYYDPGRIVGHGLAGPFQVVQGNSDKQQYSSTFTLDVDRDSFAIDFITFAGWQNGVLFKLVQPDYATTTTASFWSNLTWDTNINGLGVDFGLGWVEIDFSNTSFNNDSYFVGHFNSRQVTEPGTYLLLLTAFFALVANNKRKAR